MAGADAGGSGSGGFGTGSGVLLGSNEMKLFKPYNGSGESISCSTTSASATVAETASLVDSRYALKLTNEGATNTAFVRYGVGAQTALTSDLAVPPSSTVFVPIEPGAATVVAARTSASTTVLLVTLGQFV